jgi:putative ABC transport system substrate-binding protein
VRRREVIAGLSAVGSAAAWPLRVSAQTERTRRIAVLMSWAVGDPESLVRLAAFRDGLQKLGWREGHNLRLDIRWATSDSGLTRHFAKELVALQPDIILSPTTATTGALLQHTRAIPIIFVAVSDPVGSGFVSKFSEPGGNVTGFINVEPTMAGKWLELLKEIAPRVERIAFLFNPATAP